MKTSRADKIRARLVQISEKYREALAQANQIVADASASFAAIEEADARVKRLSAERTRLMEEFRLTQYQAPERFGPYRQRAGQRPMREQILDLVDELGVPVQPRIVFDYALATLNLSLP